MAEDKVANITTDPSKATPTVNKWSAYMYEIYRTRQPPKLGTVDIKKLEELARKKMEVRGLLGAYMYTFGSAGSYTTDHANRAAFDKWRIIPRMLYNATERNIETKIFGQTFSSPLLLAPIGVQGILHEDGELASSRAAGKLGVPAIMSSASTRSIEAYAQANGNGHRWYQLYWPKSDDVTLSLLSRAAAAGFTALVVTLDTNTIGWRPHDLDYSYLPFGHGTGVAIGATDPVFMEKLGLKPYPSDWHVEFPYEPLKLDQRYLQGDPESKERVKIGTEWLAETNSGVFRTWQDLKFLREHWKGPLVIKGIQRVEDAEIAIDYVDGIVVSNHGGRQVDGAIASLDALDKICLSEKVRAAQASGRLTVFFDSGIRTGSDIIKAIALGAQAIFLGRPYMYGLALGGEDGVAEQIKAILADFEVTLGLSGYKNIQEIYGNRSILSKV